MSDWKSIDSAPRDGTRILVCGGTWMGEICGPSPNTDVALVFWYEPSIEWSVCDTDTYSASIDGPTHWAAVPPPFRAPA